MPASVWAEVIWAVFEVFAECFHWLLFDPKEKTPWIRVLLFLFAGMELSLIVFVGFVLQPRLPMWGFVLAVSVLVICGAVGFFTLADLIRKHVGRA